MARRPRLRGAPGPWSAEEEGFLATSCENTATSLRVQDLFPEYKRKIVTRASEHEAVIILTTIGSSADPAALARTLVEEQLAACVNVLPPMTSLYRWKGSVEEDQERQLVIKTLPARVEALRERLLELHDYELPEFLVLDATGSQAYLAWIAESVRR
jgi:periplasmic divalent cation tolerance protein